MSGSAMRWCVALGTMFGLIAGVSPGAAAVDVPLAGAAKVLEAVAQAGTTNAVSAPADAAAQARDQLGRDLDSFKEKMTDRPPDERARGWLALWDRFWALPPQGGAGGESDDLSYRLRSRGRVKDKAVSVGMILAAVPGPETWPELAKLVESRPAAKAAAQCRESGLRLFVHFLNGDVARLKADLEGVTEAAAGRERYEKEALIRIRDELDASVRRLASAGGTNSIAANFEGVLETQKKLKPEGVTLRVPDLVSLAGRERAQDLLGKALDLPGVRLVVPSGRETLKLAQTMAVSRIKTLQKPQWGLVASLDAVELFEALDRKFPARKSGEGPAVLSSEFVQERGYSGGDYEAEWERNRAVSWYLLGLVSRNRTADAVKSARNMSLGESEGSGLRETWRAADPPVPAEVVFRFLGELLRSKPELHLWDEYVAFAAAAGKTDEALLLLNEIDRRKDVPPEGRSEMRRERAQLYLGLDRVEEAVGLMRAELAETPGAEAGRAASRSADRRRQTAVGLTALGRLLQKPEWMDEGISNTLRLASARTDDSSYGESQVVDAFIEGGRLAEAEALIQRRMSEQLSKSAGGDRRRFDRSQGLQGDLANLAAVYRKAGRHSDVIILFEQAPWWGASDLLELTDTGSCGGPALACILAESLHAAGRDPEAVRILKSYLYQRPSDDAAYRVLVSANSTNLTGWLDELYARDRFEERPLIWKGYVLLQSGRLQEAEKAVREALRVDPTDGEQPAGDRVRGYAVLGDILAAQGRKEDAEFFRKVVRSVRLAERGDEFTKAGLIRRSVALYQEAEALFADAYCVQWRLAERLRALGQFAEAEKHYRIAFERMPEQFGQVASLCFGCEGVFQSEQSRSVAENVLLRLEKTPPVRPQVYYLLGELRETQGRFQEALGYFQQAVQSDPGYLDVWSKIYGLREHVFLPPAEQDRVSLRMLEMDPLQRHFGCDPDNVTDLKGLWTVLEKNRRFDVPAPTSLFVLTASQARVAQAKGEAGQPGMEFEYPDYGYMRWHGVPEPGEAIAGHSMVRQIVSLMQASQF